MKVAEGLVMEPSSEGSSVVWARQNFCRFAIKWMNWRKGRNSPCEKAGELCPFFLVFQQGFHIPWIGGGGGSMEPKSTSPMWMCLSSLVIIFAAFLKGFLNTDLLSPSQATEKLVNSFMMYSHSGSCPGTKEPCQNLPWETLLFETEACRTYIQSHFLAFKWSYQQSLSPENLTWFCNWISIFLISIVHFPQPPSASNCCCLPSSSQSIPF